jgi:YD repeat-containing protein
VVPNAAPLDRPTITSLPDGTSTTQNYLGNRTESVDQAGKRWYRYTDSLGRLTQVAEAPTTYNLNTYYSYTAHDKLRTVCQGGTLSGSTCSGGQARTFTFDGLGRMLSANNPESGTTSYDTTVAITSCRSPRAPNYASSRTIPLTALP